MSWVALAPHAPRPRAGQRRALAVLPRAAHAQSPWPGHPSRSLKPGVRGGGCLRRPALLFSPQGAIVWLCALNTAAAGWALGPGSVTGRPSWLDSPPPSRLHPRDGVQLSTLGRPMPVNRCPYKINGSHTRRVFIYNCPNVNPAAAASPAAVRRWGLGIAV